MKLPRPELRLTHKVALIGITGILGSVLIAGIFELGTAYQESARQRAQDARSLSTLTRELSLEMLRSVVEERGFLMRKEESYVKRHDDISTDIDAGFVRLKGLSEALDHRKVTLIIDSIRQGFDEYSRHFSAMVAIQTQLGVNEMVGIAGSLRAAAYHIQAKLEEAGDVKMLNQMLRIRGLEKNYIQRREQSDANEHSRLIQEMTADISQAGTEATQLETVLQGLKQYTSEFANWNLSAKAKSREEFLMNKAYLETEPLVKNLLAEINQISSDAELTEATARSSMRLQILAAIAAIALLMSALSWFLGRSISRPLLGFAKVLTSLARGNHEIDLPEIKRRDEIGQMSKAAQVFKDSMIETERLRSEHQAGQKNESIRRREERIAMADHFETAVGSIIQKVSSESGDLETSAATLTETANSTLSLSAAVASTSGRSSLSIGQAAHVAKGMTHAVIEINRQVDASSKISVDAVAQARETDVRITQLSKAANRIGDVIKLITNIAEQTNLLALNATIEAARAGDAGKGFAVVAQEVKGLSLQTAKATSEIADQIVEMQSATEESVSAIRQICSTIETISNVSVAIAAAVSNQGEATREIDQNVQIAAEGAEEVVSAMRGVNEEASKAKSASAQMLVSAKSLSIDAGQLTAELQAFLVSLRAA